MSYSTINHTKKPFTLMLLMLLAFLLSIGTPLAQAKEQESGTNRLSNMAQTGDVLMSISPATSNVQVGDTFVVTIQVEAGSQDVEGVTAYLDFDPTVLQVQSMTPITTLSLTLQNTFDNTSGQIDYGIATFSAPYLTGTFDLLEIEFQAIADNSSSTLAFQFVNPRNTDVRAPGIADTILTGSTDGNVVVGATASLDAEFNCSPTSGPAPLEVTCTDASTGDITSWAWDFGDGTTSTDQNPPAHTYNADGSYTVSLTVTGANGSDTETRANYISVGGAARCDLGVDGDNTCVLVRGNVFPSIENIIFDSFVLDGQIGTTSASTGGNVLDSDETDAGWSIYVAAAAPFVDDNNNQIPIGGEDDLTVECLTISTDDGQAAPTCHTIDHVRLLSDTNKTTIISASPGTARGTYNFTADFVLTIPGDTVAGNYTTTIYIDRQIGSDGP